ncbi:hypothetical protein ACTFIY_010827 [Dictyostelium cf. discoideum]
MTNFGNSKEEIDEKSTLLFFKIWRNVYTKKLILKHLRLFNLFPFPVCCSDLENKQIINENKNHINSISVKCDKILFNENEETINYDDLLDKFNNISEWVESIELKLFLNIPLSSSNEDLSKSIQVNDNQLKCLNKVKSISIKTYLQQNLNYQFFNLFPNLVSINLGDCLNQIIIKPGVLPKQLKHLKLNYYYNEAITENQFPMGLQVLEFGNSFDQPIDNLPNSLTTIKFPNDSFFKKRINSNNLPKSLTKLNLSKSYDSSLIDGVLPNSILKLKISNYTNKSILHTRLEFKIFEKDGNISLNNQLSKFINNLSIIPPSVTKLSIFYGYEQVIPYQIKSMHLEFSRNNQYDHYYKQLLNNPYGGGGGGGDGNGNGNGDGDGDGGDNKIKSLNIISLLENKPLDIYYGNNFNCFNGLINLNLSNFEYNSFKKPIKRFTSFKNLKCLSLGEFKSSLNQNPLPETLELLELGKNFKQPINKKWLPPSIKYIIINDINTPISIEDLPNSLISIWITDNHYQLKYFKYFTPLLGKLKIVDSINITTIYKRILRKKYEINY